MFDGNKPLFTRKIRAALSVIACIMAIFALTVCVLFPAVKIPALYAFTASLIFLVTVRKNYVTFCEISIFCFLLIQLVVLVPKPEDFNDTAYLLSFRYGISSRGFIPTIIDILNRGEFIHAKFIWHFLFTTLALLSFVLSVLIGLIIKNSKARIKPFAYFLALFYLTCFTAPSMYFFHFNRFEIFAFLFMLIIIAVLEKPVLRWGIPILALCILASHIILIFFYIPFIVIMLLYELIKTQHKKKIAALLCCTVAVIAGAFLLYLLFHENTFVFNDAHSMAEFLKTKTDFPFNENMIYMFMYARLHDHLDGWKSIMVPDFSGNFSVIINIPFIALFAVFWVNCFLREKNKPMKFFFTLPVLILLYHAIAFFLFFDFGRWLVMIMNIQIMLLFYLIYAQNETVISVAEKTIPFIQEKSRFIILACVLMAWLGPVTVIGPSARVTKIFHVIFHLFGWTWSV
ncbi:MAG: hypothetical protein Pg6A_09040 [Termitinemataceae bacterium]|nr:MAG: hypothetical protein Pg6A_09040 [Termitinemataceae bacterium]